jgi:transposase-like protein
MQGRKHKPAEVIRKLRQAEAELAAGTPLEEVCRTLEISDKTLYRWRKRYGGSAPEAAKELKRLEAENARLKKVVAELELDKAILKEALSGKY